MPSRRHERQVARDRYLLSMQWVAGTETILRRGKYISHIAMRPKTVVPAIAKCQVESLPRTPAHAVQSFIPPLSKTFVAGCRL
jgi:hypothetical protein